MNRTQPDGLQYEIDIGAFISKVDSEVAGRLKVSLGDISGRSEEYRQVHYPETIDIALASDTVWSDRPFVLFAVQVRDNFLSTHLSQEVVSASLEHPTEGTIASECQLEEESGTCSMNISLSQHMSWFAGGDVMVDLNVTARNIYNTTQITLESSPDNISGDIFMKVPAYSVFPDERIEVPIYATYNHLLSSFTLNCSVESLANIIGFSGSYNWSLISTSLDDQFASVTGFRNYDADSVEPTNSTPDLLANMSLQMGNITENSTVYIQCMAVGLLLTTRVQPGANFYVNATDRDGVNSGGGKLYAAPVSPVKLFAYSGTNELINTASVTGERSIVELHVKAYNTNGELGPVTEGLQCTSEDDAVIQVQSNCSQMFLDGTESEGSQTSIRITAESGNSGISTSLPFKVWFPSPPVLEVDDQTLNRINTSTMSCSNIYQSTHVHAVTNLTLDEVTIYSVYITPLISLVSTSPNVNITGNKLQGISPGEAEVKISNTDYSVYVTVTDSETVDVQYLDVFTFSQIEVSVLDSDITPLASSTAEIALLQDFQYITSELYVVGVAVFSDGQRMVLDADITEQQGAGLEKVTNNKYIFTDELNDTVEFRVTWMESQCMIKSQDYSIYIQGSIPSEIEIRNQSLLIIAPAGDPAHVIGVPTSVELDVILLYEDGNSTNVIPNRNVIITWQPENLTNITENGTVTATGQESGVVTVTALYTGTVNRTASVNITVVTTVNLYVLAHPYPSFEGSDTMTVSTIRKVGFEFQMVTIETRLRLSNGIDHDVSHYNETSLTAGNGSQLDMNVLTVDSSISDGMQIELTVNFTEELSNITHLMVDTSNPLRILSIEDVRVTPNVTQQNWYQVDCIVRLEGDIILNTELSYKNLVQYFIDVSSDAVAVNNETGRVQLLENSHEALSLCVRARSDNSIHNCSDFNANLQPEPGEIDLGTYSGLPLRPVDVGDPVVVPVVLNLAEDPVGVYEMEVTFDQQQVMFDNITQGEDWRSGLIVYTEPAENDTRIKFGGVLHSGAQGAMLHLADITFISVSSGIANFSANVSFISAANVSLTSLTEENQVSPASQISVVIHNGSSSIQKRESREYKADEEPPLAPPPVAYRRHSVSRMRRAAPQDTCPTTGDVNGDCVVDLKDLFLLQVYVAESVFNFMTPNGMLVMQEVNNTDELDVNNDGLVTLLDTEQLEIITLNLAYEAVNTRVEIEINNNLCSIEISGLVQTASEEPPSTDVEIHVFVDFSSSQPDFQDQFNSMNFSAIDEVVPFNNESSFFGGTVGILVASDSTTEFNVSGYAPSITIPFNVSVIVIVTGSDDSILSAIVHSNSSALGGSAQQSLIGEEEANSLLENEGNHLEYTPWTEIAANKCVIPEPSTTPVTPATTIAAISSSSTLSSSSMPPLPPTSSPTPSSISSPTSSVDLSSSSTPVVPSPTSSLTAATTVTSLESFSSTVSASTTPTISRSSISSTDTITATASSSVSSLEFASATSTGSSISISSSEPITSASTITSSSSISLAVENTAKPISSSSSLSIHATSTISGSSISSTASADSTSTLSGRHTSSTIRGEPVPASTTVVESTSSSLVSSSDTIIATATTPSISADTIIATATTPSISADTIIATATTPSISASSTPTDAAEKNSNNNLAVPVVIPLLITIILVLTVIAVVFGVRMLRMRNKGLYLIDHSNGTQYRNAGFVTNSDRDFWAGTEAGIVSNSIRVTVFNYVYTK